MSLFPHVRLRRLRRTPALRRMFNETCLSPEKMVWPVFLVPGTAKREAIESMPRQYRMSIDVLLKEVEFVVQAGIGGVLLFGLVDDSEKDRHGHAAYDERGVVQAAVRSLRNAFPELIIITDVCLCAYTKHGHCGPLTDNGSVDNDAANEMLAKVALSHAAAGADMVAPSAMMDGQVLAIRNALEADGFDETLLMSYSSKFASSMYGPFRDAEKSAPQQGDRRGYQVPYGGLRQALRESVMDEDEGADILMVKPSLFYLDILVKIREQTDLPLASYNVSGEYAMLIATADRGWGDLKGMVRESMTALSRAGSDIIISYWANQYNEYLRD